MKHAVFIEPSGALYDRLQAEKAEIMHCRPGQPYVSHPPHCTLIFTTLANPDDWLPRLRKQLAAAAPLSCRVAAKVVFYDDPAAGGAHVIAYRLDITPELQQLQLLVAETLEPFVQQDLRSPLPGDLQSRTSQQRFGFPFVGPHWLPHFTVAGLHGSRSQEWITRFLATAETFAFRVEQVSIWAIAGDDHQRLAGLPLGGGHEPSC